MIATVTLNPSLDRVMTVDGLVVDESNRWTSLRKYPGGKGINVSRVVHELGGETIAYGLVGGADGKELTRLLKEQGVPTDFVTIANDIRSNIVISDLKTHHQTRIGAPGPTVTQDELHHLVTKVMNVNQKPDFLVFAGSAPPGVPPDIYCYLIGEAKKLNIRTVLDTGVEWLKEGIKSIPSIIKPNVFEAEALLGTDLKNDRYIIRAVRAFISSGIDVALISRGKKGFIAAYGDKIIKAIPPEIEALSTVGAGDATIAGLTLKLSQAGTFEDACRLACAAGAATALTPGTELCHRSDVERLLPQVKIDPK